MLTFGKTIYSNVLSKFDLHKTASSFQGNLLLLIFTDLIGINAVIMISYCLELN